jgi:hypothetical protein
MDLRQSRKQGTAPLLVLLHLSRVHPAGSQSCQDHGQGGMAYRPSFPDDDFEVAWRRCEDSAGATAACKQQHNHEPLRASGD